MSNILFAIIEDDKVVSDALCEIISRENRFKCVGKFYSASTAKEYLAASKPNVVLVDLKLGEDSGIDIIKEFKPKMPSTQFMVITIFEENELIIESLKAGATGYILKNSRPEEYVQAIDILVAGGSPLSPTVARKLVGNFQAEKAEETYNLTAREKQIVEQLATGYLYKQVADNLNISMDTVRSHIRNVYEKLQVQSKVQALNKFYGR